MDQIKRPYGGRKPKGESRRTEVITIRISREDKNKMKKKAAESGLNITDYILTKCL